MTTGTTPKSPLDGLVSCGACGAPMEYEAPTQAHEASYACRSVHTSGGDSRPPLRVEAHTTDRAVIRSVLEAILTERGNFILESTIRNLEEQEDTGPKFPSEDISLLKEDPYFFLQAVKGMENARNFLATFISSIKLFPERAVVQYAFPLPSESHLAGAKEQEVHLPANLPA